jgi:circadian clock protein KaiC
MKASKPPPADRIQRVKTGIPGFDAMLGGGLVGNSITVVRGDMGTAKTLLGLQYLYHGASKLKEPGVYMSFYESADAVFSHGAAFGWDFKDLSDKGLFQAVKYNPHEIIKSMKEGGGIVRDTIESMHTKRLVVDSITAYQLFFESRYEADQSLLNFFEMMKTWNVTTLATAELAVSLSRSPDDRLGFLADGVINLYQLRKRFTRIRALEVVKMRDTVHSEQISLFTIGDHGLELIEGGDRSSD